MGSSQATTNQNNTNSTCQVLPPSKYSAESITFIPVTVPMSNYIISMISRIQGFFHGSDTNENVPNYSKTIKQRLEHFNNIQANICEKKYKNIGEILKDIDGVWKSMYELTTDQTQHNKQHDPKSDFITFAAGIESEFYNLWDQFEQLLIQQGYLNEEVILSSKKMCNNNNNNNNKSENDYDKSESKEEEIIDVDMINNNNNNNMLVQGLKDWLTNTVELPQYYNLFVSNGFEDMSFIIGIIRTDDLKEMGIHKIGHRRKILHYADSPDNKKRKLDDSDDEMNNNDNGQPLQKKRRICE